MASDKDKLFEKIYFLWKGEGEKRFRLRMTEWELPLARDCNEQPEYRLVLRSELCSRAPKEATLWSESRRIPQMVSRHQQVSIFFI